jgi:hypothetical protein
MFANDDRTWAIQLTSYPGNAMFMEAAPSWLEVRDVDQ